jgi:hypothetical protein
MVLGLLQLGVAERLLRLPLQGRADLVVADATAVLRDQCQQRVGEVGADGYRQRGRWGRRLDPGACPQD